MANLIYYSIYTELIEKYLDYHLSLGHNVTVYKYRLRQFDRLVIERGEHTIGITKELFNAWEESLTDETDVNFYYRVTFLCDFSKYLQLMGYNSYVPRRPKYQPVFTPHIYSAKEMESIFRECDKLYCKSNIRHTSIPMMPCLIRLLYSTGIRIGEALNLKNDDVSFNDGLLIVREPKNGVERYVPMSPTTNAVCQDFHFYKVRIGLRCKSEDYFFVAPDGKTCEKNTIYSQFRNILFNAGIPHGGRGRGPRLHDLRHTFCVNALVKMGEEGLDYYASMPALMTYMGHKSISATNHYIHLTSEIYPKLVSKLEETYKYLFPDLNVNPEEYEQFFKEEYEDYLSEYEEEDSCYGEE